MLTSVLDAGVHKENFEEVIMEIKSEPGVVNKTNEIEDLQLQPSSIVVFHPGSRNFRFGRASDSEPQSILHAIARRRKSKTAVVIRDSLIPLSGRKALGKLPPEVESARLQLCHTIQTAHKSDGSPRYATPTQQIAAYNKRSTPVSLPDKSQAWDEFLGQESIIGDSVLKVCPHGEFNIHFPWRRGQLNIHPGIGGSLTAVMTDLEDIWMHCVETKLGIPRTELKNYRAIVIIPTMTDKNHAKEMMNLVITRMGFGGAFLIQDHVSATFGSGLACATVVDVGDQKISVSCVEDAISFPQSRIEMKYGGGDLTLALWNLINQSAVPLQPDLNVLWDVEFLIKLKENFCHFNLNRCGPEERTIIWDRPGEVPIKYNILLADELMVVPLSFFNPDLLRGSISSKPVVVHKPQSTASDDPFDTAFITETSRRALKEAEGEADEDFIDDTKDHENPCPTKIDADKLLGIEQAILQSIDSCNQGDELKRRLYANILIVGGGFKFDGLGGWLQNKIVMNTPRMFKTDPQEVITQPKDSDASTTVWKGASILSTLETADELWISQSEWVSCGSRILRERSLCTF